MQVTVEKIDDINYVLRGSVDNKVIEDKVEEFKKSAEQNPDHIDTAPDGSEQAAAGAVFDAFIAAGIKEAKIDVNTLLGQPALRKYEQKEDSVFFEVELSVSPEINTDVDYMAIMPKYTKPVPNPEDVEKKLLEFASQQAPFTPVATPKSIENGDVAVIDFTGYVDGVPFEGGSAQKYKLKVGSQSFIPGFEEQLIGMEYGEERDITVTFPSDYSSDDLAGKESKFEVKLHEIHEQKAPTPDDAFAQRILGESDATLDTLKEKLGDQVISEELSAIYVRDLKPKIVEGLLGLFDFTLPNNIVEQEIDAKVREKTRHFSEEEHKSYMEDKDKFVALRESLREEAKATIKRALIVEAIAKKEKVDVDENEVVSALTYQAMMAGQDANELVKYYRDNNLMTSAKMGLTEDKLFGQLLGFHK